MTKEISDELLDRMQSAYLTGVENGYGIKEVMEAALTSLKAGDTFNGLMVVPNKKIKEK